MTLCDCVYDSVEIREYISVVFDYLLTGCWAIIGTTEKRKEKKEKKMILLMCGVHNSKTNF